MAYVSIEADERMEEGPAGLQFQSFLETDARETSDVVGGTGSNAARGYIPDKAARPSGFWTVEYYQPYFDIDTKTVLRRCYSTIIPTEGARHFISTHLTPADLYGPFWTLTTLIFSLFVFSSLAASVAIWISDPTTSTSADMTYDFGLLSLAVGIVYIYGLAFPVMLWLGLRYLGVGEWSIVEAVALWGYGQFVWIPVSLLCVIWVPIVKWVVIGLGLIASTTFLVANIYPILASGDAKAVRLIIVLIVILQAGLALCFKVLFFSYYPEHQIGVKDPISITIPDGKSPASTATEASPSSVATAVASATAAAATTLVRRWLDN